MTTIEQITKELERRIEHYTAYLNKNGELTIFGKELLQSDRALLTAIRGLEYIKVNSGEYDDVACGVLEEICEQWKGKE